MAKPEPVIRSVLLSTLGLLAALYSIDCGGSSASTNVVTPGPSSGPSSPPFIPPHEPCPEDGRVAVGNTCSTPGQHCADPSRVLPSGAAASGTLWNIECRDGTWRALPVQVVASPFLGKP